MSENKKILFMDDDESIYRVVEFMMERLGYDVSFSKCGEETIDAYRDSLIHSKPFSAIILDLNVDKGMGGAETIQKLLAVNPDVKAIVSSGDNYDPVMINYQKYGFVSSISKPYNVEMIKMVLKRAIDGKHENSE
jgi:DNA-binding NtrC family response regulator